jgi:hypothetical protein
MDIVTKIFQNEIIDKMPLVINVKEINDRILSVCYTGWIRKGSTIKDDNNVEYRVVSFVFGVSVTVDRSGFIGNILLKKPTLIDATIIQGTKEYTDLSHRTSEKTPLIFLQDGSIVDRKNQRSSLDGNISGTIYFIDFFDLSWNNEKINNYVLTSINEMTEIFLSTVEENHTFFKNVESFLKTERKRFGKESDVGVLSTYLNDFLSAIEVRFSINVNKTYKQCCEYIPVPPLVCAPAIITNSTNTFTLTVASGEKEILPGTFYEIEVDGVVKDSFQLPTLEDSIITIELI